MDYGVLQRRVLAWSEFKEGALFHILPYLGRVTLGFFTQGVTPMCFLNWLKINELDGDVAGPAFLKSWNEHRKVTLVQLFEIAGDSSDGWARFNSDCPWFRLDGDDFDVEYNYVQEMDFVTICVAAPRKKLLPGLKFFFKTISHPDFTPIVAVPERGADMMHFFMSQTEKPKEG